MTLVTEEFFTVDECDVLEVDRFGRMHTGTAQAGGALDVTKPSVNSGSLLIQRQDVGVAHLVTVFGTLDRNTVEAFVEFTEWLSNDPTRVVHLDLGNLRVVDIAAVAAIDDLTSNRSGLVSPVHVLIASAAMNQLRQLVSGIPR